MRRTFSVTEMNVLGGLLGLLIIPLFAVLMRYTPVWQSAWLIITACAVTAVFWIRMFYYHSRLRRPTLAGIFRHPLVWAAIFYIAVAYILSQAFLALPDIDAYHWIKAYRLHYLAGQIDQIPSRLLFFGLVHTLATLFQLPPLAVFKYILPLAYLLLLPPLWLIAKTEPKWYVRAGLLSLPLFSPSLLLALAQPVPQTLLLILTTYVICLLIYAQSTRNPTWHWLAGAFAAVSFLYHGAGILIFLCWVVATILAWRNKILSRLRRQPESVVALTTILILMSYVPALVSYLHFNAAYIHWLVRASLRFISFNPTFPAQYLTIDGEPNGWPGVTNLLKYYGFYAGPATLLLLGSAAACLRSFSLRKITREFLTSAPLLTIFFIFVLFFSIAEIIPRLIGIAFLPERAWLFVSVTSLAALPALASRTTLRNVLPWLLLLCSAVSIGAAWYINHLKAHIIPDYQVRSATFLSTLPDQRLIISDKSSDFLDTHAQSPFLSLPETFYCQYQSASSGELQAALRQQVQLQSRTLPPDYAARPLYIYYYRHDPAHPYAARPWKEIPSSTCENPPFDKHPKVFRKLYQEGNDAIIWQVL